MSEARRFSEDSTRDRLAPPPPRARRWSDSIAETASAEGDVFPYGRRAICLLRFSLIGSRE